MHGYLYHYKCSRWYGEQRGLKNIFVSDQSKENLDVVSLARQDAQKTTGSDTCDVQLLQKFDIVIRPIATYSSLVDEGLEGLSHLQKDLSYTPNQD